MSKKCKYCYRALKEGVSVCGVCKIDSTKDKKTITKEEKRASYYCRTLYVIGSLAALGGIIGFISILPLLSKPSIEGEMPWIVTNFILAVIFVFFGLSLIRYKKWCYIGGIVLYSIAIMINLIQPNPLKIIFGILFLAYIVAPTSKKILYRQL